MYKTQKNLFVEECLQNIQNQKDNLFFTEEETVFITRNSFSDKVVIFIEIIRKSKLIEAICSLLLYFIKLLILDKKPIIESAACVQFLSNTSKA